MDALRRSLELCQVPATTFNLAIALRGMGDDVAAASLLRRLLEGELAAEQRQQVLALLDEISAHMGSLRVTVSPDVPFQVGDTRYEAGTVVQLPLNVGHQRLVISAEGFEPRHLDLEVRPGASLSETIELLRPRGWLELRAGDSDTTLEIVGVGSIRGTLLRRQLRPGEYELRSSLGDLERRSSASLSANQTLRVDMSIEAPSRWPRRLGIAAAILAVLAVGALIAWRVASRPRPTTDPTWGRIDLN
ncbi:MAG: hypothetical protein GXP55_20025 [Deltaproteobacteria bacterium]|nr:hypothetical protein [Deltaproteobacteria bacterium]